MPTGPKGQKRFADAIGNRMSPAMAAGVSDRLWSMEDVATLIETATPKPGKRGPYKKSVSVDEEK